MLDDSTLCYSCGAIREYDDPHGDLCAECFQMHENERRIVELRRNIQVALARAEKAEARIKTLEKALLEACSCDLLYGWICNVHEVLNSEN